MSSEPTALLLIDIQEDFLRRPGLLPEAPQFVERISALLEGFRQLGLPVVHAHTRVSADGKDAMPHWRDRGVVACRAGSPGSIPPPQLAPREGEPLFYKRFFSPFENPGLAAWLEEQQVTTLVVAGLYSHACVRAAVLDAYALGLRVVVPQDGVATTDALHGEITREYLSSHGTTFAPINGILAALAEGRAIPPVIAHSEERTAIEHARRAATDWGGMRPERRGEILRRWRANLEARRASIIAGIIEEIAKPASDAAEEFDRALAHIESAAELASRGDEALADGLRVRYRPLGCVALVTPWNNPLAIPVGKIAPALAFGNAVLWKPSPQAMRTALALISSLRDTEGLPDDIVALFEGDGETARRLMLDDAVNAVSLTGGPASGRIAAALCAISGKPLQAELGGNNAHVVLAGADLPVVAEQLARAAFSFSGQRCTAVRRVIAAETVYADFLSAFVAVTEKLPVGPLLSKERALASQTMVDRAIAAGARLVAGGTCDAADAATFLPTILECADPNLEIVQRESFAPIVVMLKARDASDGLRLANAVPQGLLAGVSGGTLEERRFFLDRVEVGIVRLGGPPRIDAAAPFGGWKASGFGAPEHGRWDREFYARPQAVYDETMVIAP
jgi:acyl-CoA reductase-like NAD-dependent aldehyde dehydrogenase/nicotinamidase-related amidase